MHSVEAGEIAFVVSEVTPALEFAENQVMAQWAFVMLLDVEARAQYPIVTSTTSFFLTTGHKIPFRKFGWRVCWNSQRAFDQSCGSSGVEC